MNEKLEINKEILRKLFKKGLTPTALCFLYFCRDEEAVSYFQNTQIEINLLSLGYITPTPSLTDKGKELLKELVGEENMSTKIDTSNKWHDLHKELQDTLFKLTGKKQAKANGDYTFLCNERDLQHKLARVITKYKLTDWEKIRKLLVLHIHKAYKQKFEKVFLIAYYIEKNGMSTLASDYDNFIEKEEKIETVKENKGVFNL